MGIHIRILFPISIINNRTKIRILIRIFSFMDHLVLVAHHIKDHKKAVAPFLEILFC